MENERDDEGEPEREQRQKNLNDHQQNDDDQNDQQQRPQPQPQPQPQQGRNNKKCPRCESFNTKFCYYNNYNLSQPRYFCKACKRYWTHGGTLRNVPVGGGCRKPKRGRPSTSTAADPKPPLPPPTMPTLHAAKPIMQTLPSIYTNGGMFASLGNPSHFKNGTPHMSSLVGNQYMNNLAPCFNQVPVNPGNGASNMAMLQGFNHPQNNFNIPPPNQPADIFDVGRSGGQVKRVAYDQSFTNSQLLTVTANDSWQQSFVNSASDGMWSFDHGGISNSSKNANNMAGSASSDPNQWFDLPGFGPHPP